jgi:hypothetical protein
MIYANVCVSHTYMGGLSACTHVPQVPNIIMPKEFSNALGR